MLWVHKTSSPELGEKGEPWFSEKIPSTSLTGSAKESRGKPSEQREGKGLANRLSAFG